MSFLTPQLFDVLVLVVVVVGLVAAAIRIRSDFRQGPRWPEEGSAPEGDAPTTTTGEQEDA